MMFLPFEAIGRKGYCNFINQNKGLGIGNVFLLREMVFVFPQTDGYPCEPITKK